MIPLRKAFAAVMLVLALPLAAPPAAAAERAAVVVELFTSQGCSSCPPADAYLAELAERDGVLALSMHVDYWNRLGWTDPFSRPEVTERQRGYMRALGGRYVYTPQMVVAGRADAVGSERAAVERMIAEARRRAAADPAPFFTVRHEGHDRLGIRVGEGQPARPATLWLVAFDERHETDIPAGENAGRTLAYTHVVRDIRAVGTWRGPGKTFTVDIGSERAAGYGYCAVLLQEGRTGPIRAAAMLPLAPSAR